MCLRWQVGGILLCILMFFLPNVGGQDGTLTCPTTWYDSANVELLCTSNKFRMNNCSSNTATSFFKDNILYCSIPSRPYNSCIDAGNTTRPQGVSCWCLQNSTDYIFKYVFTADSYLHSGTWTCRRNCINITTTLPYPMQITNCSNVNVQGSACDSSNNPCNSEGTEECALDKVNRDRAVCKCKVGYNPPNCEKCGFCGCQPDPCWPVAFIVVICLLGVGVTGGSIYGIVCCNKQKSTTQQNTPSTPANPDSHTNARSGKDVIGDKNRGNADVESNQRGRDNKTESGNDKSEYSTEHKGSKKGKRKKNKVAEEDESKLTNMNQASPPVSTAHERISMSAHGNVRALPNPSSNHEQRTALQSDDDGKPLTSVERNSRIRLPPLEH